MRVANIRNEGTFRRVLVADIRVADRRVADIRVANIRVTDIRNEETFRRD